MNSQVGINGTKLLIQVQKMQQLEIEFRKQYANNGAALSLRKQQLKSQIKYLYPEHSEADILNELLQTSSGNNDTPTLLYPTHVEFIRLCDHFGFAGFSFVEIATTRTANGEIKKMAHGFPQWTQVTRSNYKQYIKGHHKAFAIATGHVSGITVIDCDNNNSYLSIIHDYPQLATCLTVKTNRGTHIYCQYDKGIATSTESFESYRHVDIRNDIGLIFAPPTSYALDGGKTWVRYQFTDESCAMVPFPPGLRSNIKPAFIDLSSQLPPPTSLPLTGITCIEALTMRQVSRALQLLKSPVVIKQYPVICNGIFEIGYQLVSKDEVACYYVKMFEILKLKVVRDLQWVLARLHVYENELTFDVYEIGAGTYCLYCVSRSFSPIDEMAGKLAEAFECDKSHHIMSLRMGWVTPIYKEDRPILDKKVGRFGKCAIIEDFHTLLQLKDNLVQHFQQPMSPAILSTRHLADEIQHVPAPVLQGSLFITFPTSSSPSPIAV